MPQTRSLRCAGTFYLISLGLSLAVALAAPVLGDMSTLLVMLTPAIAVVAMLTVLAPEGGFRAALIGLGLTKAGTRGWPIAIGAPFAIHTLGLALLAGAGLVAFASFSLGGAARLIPHVLIGVVISVLLALFEEVGWRGYMLPRMSGYSVVTAMLLVGFLHGLWHLPILLLTDFYHATGNPWIVAPLFLVTLTLAGVFYGFLRVWTGSIWPVAIAHAAANTAWNVSSTATGQTSPVVAEYIGGESGVIMIVGLLIVDAILVAWLRRQGGTAAGLVRPSSS
jgi:uncharacterized protein